MSVQAMSAVFDVDLAPHLKWLLMCLANSATPDGSKMYPSVGTLSRLSGNSERTVQRLLRELERLGLIEPYDEPDNPFRTISYRITFVPGTATKAPRPNMKSCPPGLRQRVITAFARTCSYCNETGDDTLGPDGQKWHIDRLVPGSRGGAYEPSNITLSCGTCNRSKRTKDAPGGTRSLQDIEGQEGAIMAGSQAAFEGAIMAGGEGATYGTQTVLRTVHNRPKSKSRACVERKFAAPTEPHLRDALHTRNRVALFGRESVPDDPLVGGCAQRRRCRGTSHRHRPR